MRIAPLLFLCLLLAGCVSSTDLDRLHREVNDLHAEVLNLKAEAATKADVKQAGQGLEKETQRIVRTNADLALRVNEFATEVEALEAQLKDTNVRLTQLSQQIAQSQRTLDQLRGQIAAPPLAAAQPAPPAAAAPGAGPVPAPAPSAPPYAPAPPVDLYGEAYGDYMQARYEMAIEGFKQFIKENASSEQAADALFYLGESQYNLKMYKEATASYEQLLSRFPRSAKGPAARLKKGLAHFELGEKTQGIVELQYCMYEYPTSEEAQMAKEKLAALGISAR